MSNDIEHKAFWDKCDRSPMGGVERIEFLDPNKFIKKPFCKIVKSYGDNKIDDYIYSTEHYNSIIKKSKIINLEPWH